ncbi:ATP-dependent RNA helicase p62 [Eurytemora carolleeae]|uniref:ATP-dependent RNA helicase p62 n=1 Tax=Eurytemora carolleeae TaxID=1294199 RepID=UPI000C774305|nr:ATP-dependent RNA helicase p62 [Eurytemora carolleeae]|eukprot:XP_023335062.1 ATP-dependent RNA helicase p62-like [Eurytemora affinis]
MKPPSVESNYQAEEDIKMSSEIFMECPAQIKRMNIVENIEEMNWMSSLVSSLRIPNRFRKEIKYCKPIQKGMWPVVSSLSSTLGIAGVSQGKTYGWILPLLNQLETKKNTTYDFLTPDYGGDPTCLVLVPDHTTAESLAETIKDLVHDSRLGLEVAVAHHAVSDLNLTVSLLNSPDILVATPPQLHRLLYSYSASVKQLFYMNRCCHLVVEDAHKTLELFPEEMIHITRQFDATHPDLHIKARDNEPRPFQQLIVVGEYWCTAIQNYCSMFLNNGVTLIADMMEGAIRREIPLFPAFFSSTEKKVEKIIQICEDNRQNNVVVICKDREAGSPIYDKLQIQGFNPTFLREENEEEKDNVLLGLGKITAGRILLITDVWWNIFPENQKLQISGDILIHSDLPSSPLTFKSRFSILRGHMSKTRGLGNVVSSHIFICQQESKLVYIIQIIDDY